MKKLFISMIFVFLAITANRALANDGGIADCQTTMTNCDQWYTTTITITLPEYPNCPIDVTYNFQICNGTVYNIYVHQASFFGPYPPECQEMFDKYFDSFEYNNEFWQKLWDAVTLYIANSIKESDPSRIDCNQGASITFENYWGACNRTAYFGLEGSGTPNRVERLACNDLICCVHGKTICWDASTNTFIETIFSNSYISGDCEKDPPAVPNAIYVTPCQSPCE